MIQNNMKKPSFSNQVFQMSKVVLWISILVLIVLWAVPTAQSGETSTSGLMFKIALAGVFTSLVILGLFALHRWAIEQANIERAKRRKAWRRKVANGDIDNDDDDDDCYCINLTVTVTSLPSKNEDAQNQDSANKDTAPLKNHTPQDKKDSQHNQPEE